MTKKSCSECGQKLCRHERGRCNGCAETIAEARHERDREIAAYLRSKSDQWVGEAIRLKWRDSVASLGAGLISKVLGVVADSLERGEVKP